MKVTLRLYRPHDMDLIAMKRDEAYHLGREIKRCLLSYAKGEIYSPPAFRFDNNDKGYIPKVYQMHIILSNTREEERDAIKILNGIRPGYRCAFLKTLFRSCAPSLPLMSYADQNGYITSKDSTNIIRDIIKGSSAKADSKTTQPDTSEKEAQPIKPKTESIPKKEDNKERREESVQVTKEPPQATEETNNNRADSASADEFDKLFAGFDKLGR